MPAKPLHCPSNRRYLLIATLLAAVVFGVAASSPEADAYFLGTDGNKPLATDSAAAATAMATGRKTDAQNISWRAGDPPNGELTTIAEELRRDRGFAIGVASTVPFAHATPACFVSHNVHRGNKWEIAHEILFVTQPEVVIGGGRGRYFKLAVEDGRKTSRDRDGNRQNDDYDAFVAGSDGTPYTFVERRDGEDGGDLLAAAGAQLELANGDKLFGLFGGKGGSFAASTVVHRPGEPQLTRDATDPELQDVVETTLRLLAQDEDGFFVMFEQGDIDWSNHGHAYARMVGGVIDLHRAVSEAERLISQGELGAMTRANTLVIVTSDHANSYMRARRVLKQGELPKTVYRPGARVPSGYGATGDGTGWVWVDDPDAADITYGTRQHTNELVTVQARGAGARLFAEELLDYPGACLVDNTSIARVIRRAVETAGARHVILFIGDGMQLQHEIAGSRYLHGRDDGLAWHSWGSRDDGWAGYATTWDIDTYNAFAKAAGKPPYEPGNFDPRIGYDPAVGGTRPSPLDE